MGKPCPHCGARLTASNTYRRTEGGVICKALSQERCRASVKRSGWTRGGGRRPRRAGTWSSGASPVDSLPSKRSVPARVWRPETGWRDVLVCDDGKGNRTIRRRRAA